MKPKKSKKILLTATKTMVIDFRRFYKRPQRVFGKREASELLLEGSTIEFQNDDQLLRALAGKLTSKEGFGTTLGP